MKTSWLHRQGNSSCIVFFAGWGMDPAPFEHIPIEEHDLVIIYDYTKLHAVNPGSLTGRRYAIMHLVAWSMGVWVAPLMLDGGQNCFASSTAINGTLTPIDDRCGIGVKTYDTMIDTFSVSTLADFYRSMFSRSVETDLFFSSLPERAPDDISGELVSLKHAYGRHGSAPDCYTRKIVGTRDRIFTARNQARCWGKGGFSLLRVSHFPFYTWSSWDCLIANETSSP